MLSSLRPLPTIQRLRYCLSLYSGKVRCLSITNHCQQQQQQKQNSNGKFKAYEIKGQFENEYERMSPRQRLKNLFVVYGPTATILHIALSLSFLGVTYLVVRYGFDVPKFLSERQWLNEKYAVIIANSGTFGLAYALYKAMMPFRIVVTLFLTPKVARTLQRYGIIKRKF